MVKLFIGRRFVLRYYFLYKNKNLYFRQTMKSKLYFVTQKISEGDFRE